MTTTDDPIGPPHVADATFEVDLKTAEALLFELACRLRCIPLDEHTRALHVAALVSKRSVTLWPSQLPSPEERRAAIDGLVRLHDEAKEWGRVQRGGA